MVIAEEVVLINRLKETLRNIQNKDASIDLTDALSLVDQLEKEKNKENNSLVVCDEFSFIFNQLNIEIYIKDSEFKYIYANKKLLNTIGYKSIKDIYGKTDYDLNLDKRLCDRFYNMYVKMREDKLPVKGEISSYVKDDSSAIIWYETHKSPIINIENKVIGFLGILEDITDRKFMYQEMMHREARLRNYFLNTNDGIFVLDYKFDIIDVNPAVYTITGYSKDELIAKNFFSLFIESKDLNRFKDASKAIDINSDSFECSLLSKSNAAVKHLKLDLLNVEIDHFICFAYDISDLKRAVTKAEESNKLKTAFLQNISHEIRTPLNAIIGFSNILVQKLYDTEEDADAYKQVIYSNSEYLLGLVNNVLDLSKIETGQTNLFQEDIILVPFIKNDVIPVIISEKNRLEKSNVEIKLDLQKLSSDCLIHTDAGRLKQIITNLMHNALKFTSEGSVELRVMEDQDYIHFIVSDTGIGIAEDQLNRVFHRFYKVQGEKNTALVNSQGSGLGLAIVKKLLDLMGGRIKVESEVNKGTQFVFEIPKHL